MNQNEPKDKLRAILDELIAAQGKMSDAAFCREYNWAYSDATWNRLKNGKYTGDMEKAALAAEALLRRIRERKALASKARAGIRFHALTPFRTVLDRLGILLEQRDPTQNRLVMYLAPSGGGKTALAREAKALHGGCVVEASESWRNNYFSALTAICDALEISGEDHLRSPRAAEQALIAKLRARKTVLIIDEGEYFGPRSLNLLKLILNQTPTVILLLAIPVLWQRVQSRAWVEAAQVMRRTDHVEQLELVHPEDVSAFMEASGVNLNGSGPQSAALIARHANQFGRFDLVTRVAARLADGEPKPIEEVESCVLKIKAQIGFVGTGGAR